MKWVLKWDIHRRWFVCWTLGKRWKKRVNRLSFVSQLPLNTGHVTNTWFLHPSFDPANMLPTPWWLVQMLYGTIRSSRLLLRVFVSSGWPPILAFFSCHLFNYNRSPVKLLQIEELIYVLFTDTINDLLSYTSHVQAIIPMLLGISANLCTASLVFVHILRRPNVTGAKK